MKIHEKLKAIRLFKGLSQEEMAERLGYSINGYTKIERGEVDLNFTKLEKIAEVMEIDLQKLLGLNEGNILNFVESCNPTNTIQGNIFLSEARCVHNWKKRNSYLNKKIKKSNI
jgi:transcriptional regulator with XRE-family HTH domain